LLRLANAAIDAAGDDNSFIFSGLVLVGVNDVWHFLNVRFAHGPAAELTNSMSWSFTMPTFHRQILRFVIGNLFQRCQALINAFGFRCTSGEKCLAPVQLLPNYDYSVK
jgi:hypothetical protein